MAANPVISTIPISAGAGGLTINLELDINAVNAPSPYISGWETAATDLIAYIHDPVTVNIEVGYTESPDDNTPVGPIGAAGSPAGGSSVTYTQLTNLLLATGSSDVVRAVSDLPTTSSLNGQTNFFVSPAEAKVFGLISPASTAIDGYAGFGSGNTNSDFIANEALHEFTHAMGRIGGSFVLSLFQYTSPGVHYFGGSTGAPVTYFSIDGGNTALANFDQTSNAYDFDNSLTGPDPFDLAGGGTGLTSLDRTVLDMLGFGSADTCFCRGTRILTDRGEVPVEDLEIGDRVKTLLGRFEPIVWIGLGRDLVTRANKLARPVIVRAGALADGVPHRDLYLTHGHALHLDGVLIPVENLINHRSILWDEAARVVEYYHLELEDHDIVLANGAAAESYYDAGNRASFQNTRPGSLAGSRKPTYAPVLDGGALVEQVWARLFDRAGGQLATDTSDDPDLHLVVDGQRRDPAAVEDAVFAFRLQTAPTDTLLLRSRCVVPSLAGWSRSDHWPIGVAIRRIVLQQAGVVTCLVYDQPQLREGGCYPPQAGFCFTDGEFALPARFYPPLAGPLTLLVHTEPRFRMRYPLEAPLERTA